MLFLAGKDRDWLVAYYYIELFFSGSMASPPYFRCDPGRLCEGAKCCTSQETQPSLSLGDFIRLSDASGKPMESIWREDGDVCLSHFQGMMPAGVFVVSPGLFHDPCPYLTRDLKCGVYATRPLGCRDFPINNLASDEAWQERFPTATYRCMDNVRLTDQHQEYLSFLKIVLKEEGQLTLAYFFNNTPSFVQLNNTSLLDTYTIQAVNIQRARDPTAALPRSKRLIRHTERLAKVLHDMTAGRPREMMKDELANMMQPAIYTLVEDDFANRFARIDEKTKAKFRDLDKRLKEEDRRLGMLKVIP